MHTNALKLTCAVWLVAVLAMPAGAQTVADAEASLASVVNYQKVSDRLATSGQIAYDQVAAIKEAGYDVVVNLAPAMDEVNGLEGYLVADEGMTYVQIPVSWMEPSQEDLRFFFSVMEANKDRRVYVHCFANMRASAFVYLYRSLKAGVPEEEARADMNKVWDPNKSEQWGSFIDTARHQAGL